VDLTHRIHQLKTDFDRATRQHPTLARSVVLVAALVAVLSIVAPAWYFASLLHGLPDKDGIARIGEMDQATQIYDSEDKLAFTIFKQRRIDTTLSGVSPNFIHAIIAVEDQRFYSHGGFDVRRTVSAALANIRRQRAAQGGSTITQQLARQSFLTPDKTLRRKLQELILARRIEAEYPKDEILRLYLNKVYFGDGLYGVEAASQGFFGKHAADLSVSEAALLAGLVKSPSRYAPTVNMQLAVSRRNVVLEAMRENGAIDQAAFDSARAEKIVLHDGLPAEEPYGQYFKEQVRQELVERFGWERVYQGGLRVFTTVDVAMLAAAERAAADGLNALEERREAIAARRRGNKNKPAETQPVVPLQTALIALDPVTGHVRAMVGGRNFDESHFNRAVQARRQPGSAFKPFVYAAALEAGYTPATVIDHLNDPIDTLQGDWVPADGHSTDDSMTLRTGLRTSSNRAAVRLLQDVGIPQAVQYAKALGVGDVPSVPSLALGSGEVTLQSITAAYAAFANRGRVPAPIIVRRVEDRDGRVLYKAEELSTRAVSETTAFLMSNMMADVINSGTAWGVRQLGFTLPAAGKTGTTNDFNDAWFIGFTPTLVTGVWVGFDQPATILPNGYAADVAVPLWTMFMKEATRGDAAQWFKTPPGITSASVCRLSGKLAGDGCDHVEVAGSDGQLQSRSMVYTEYFVAGTEPTEYCDLHNRGFFGKIAGFFSDKPAPVDPSLTAAGQTAVGTKGLGANAAADAAAATTDETAETAPPPPEKKRGFWSRIFGRGKNDKKN
jgi:penicillin-binding protein 1A